MTGKTPDQECPRFDHCSVNKCPLHPNYKNLTTCPEDPETECRAAMRNRMHIAACHQGETAYGGMTEEEWKREERRRQGRARWEALSAEEKAKLVERGKKGLAKFRGMREGTDPASPPAPPSNGPALPPD